MNLLRSSLALGLSAIRMLGSGLVWAVSQPLAAYWWLRSLKVELWIIEGEERSSGLPLSILSGVRGTDKSYLLNLIFAGNYREHRLGRFWAWRIPGGIPESASRGSMIVVEARPTRRRLLGARDWFFIPAWVYGEVGLPRDAKALRKVSEELRQIRHHKLDFEITRDLQKFDDFYYSMYVPFASKRFGDCAEFSQYDELRSQFYESDLLLISNQETTVAGSLIMHGKNGACLWDMGIRDGKREYVKSGAGVALYHFALKHLEEHGHAKAGLGWSRPFLRDGVLQFKRKWSQRIVKGRSNGFVLKLLANTPATTAFLCNNPFIFNRAGRFYGAVFTDSDKPLSTEEIDKIDKDCFHPGMARLVVYQLRHRQTGDAVCGDGSNCRGHEHRPIGWSAAVVDETPRDCPP